MPLEITIMPNAIGVVDLGLSQPDAEGNGGGEKMRALRLIDAKSGVAIVVLTNPATREAMSNCLRDSPLQLAKNMPASPFPDGRPLPR